MTGTHRRAMERTLKAGESRLGDLDAALVGLCRALADQMDAAGADGPSSRVCAAYLSVLKDLARVLRTAPPQVSLKVAQMRSLREGVRRPK